MLIRNDTNDLSDRREVVLMKWRFNMSQTFGPYSSYQIVGDLVFTAGQIGVIDGKAANDITRQTKHALENLGNVLSDAGASFTTVVKTTVFLADMSDFDKMNKVYSEVFDLAGSRPARSTVAVKELPRVADNPIRIEIEAVAYKETA